MILEKEKYMDRLFMFNYFKREYLRYAVKYRKNLKKFKGYNQEFFRSMHEEEEKMNDLRKKVLSELQNNLNDLPKKEMFVLFTYMQSFLDSIYDNLDLDYANAANFELAPAPFPPIVPSIQNEIRKQLIEINAIINEKRQKRVKKPIEFEDLLSNEGKKILPKLIKAYKNSKPREMAYMVQALVDLTTIFSKPLPNSTQLHKILENKFGPIGSRPAFQGKLKALKQDGRNSYDDDQVDNHKGIIKAL